MQVHIFTGAKGGTGKTLMCICTSLYLINQNLKPIIIDLNIFNHDLYHVFKNLKEGVVFSEEGFNFIPLLAGDVGYLVVVDSTQLNNYALPPNGAISIYNRINTIIDIAQRRDINHKYIVVDTTFHIANLVIPAFNEDEHDWLQGHRPNSLRQARLLIWFLWTLASLERDGEITAITRVVNQLGCYNIGHFSPRRDLFHVFNPFPQLRERNRLLPFGGWWRDDFDKLIEAKVVPPIELRVMTTNVHDKLIDNRLRLIRHHNYPIQVADELLRLGGRPQNFFPIPSFEHLRGYTDALSFAELRNIQTIQGQLSEIYDLMARYLQHAPGMPKHGGIS